MLKVKRSKCKHDFISVEESNEIAYCLNCSCLSFTSVKAIKPSHFDLKSDVPPIKYEFKDSIVKFKHRADYIKVRARAIQSIKETAREYALSPSTIFLAVAYLDSICAKMATFSEIHSIAKICLILSVKFSSDGFKGYKIEKELRDQITTSYRSDEIFILKLLNYNLNMQTAFDVLTLLLCGGIVFDNEKINKKKLAFVYESVIKTALAFLENKHSLDLTQSQIALGIVGFTRQMVGLEAFCPALKTAYHLEASEHLCLEGLYKISKCFKVKKTDQLEAKRSKTQETKGVDLGSYLTDSSEGENVIIS